MTTQLNFLKASIRLLTKVGINITAIMIMLSPFLSHAATLSRQLDIGATGSDVTALQTFLAADPTLYPQGLVTGYFGVLTSAAVSNFQTRNGIDAVGRVGPITLAALNTAMAGGVVTPAPTGDVYAPIISSVNLTIGTSSALVSWNTNELARGVVYYSTTPITTSENGGPVVVSGLTAFTDMTFPSTQKVSLSGLQSNTNYYYLIYSTDQVGNVSVTWPSTFHTNQ